MDHHQHMNHDMHQGMNHDMMRHGDMTTTMPDHGDGSGSGHMMMSMSMAVMLKKKCWWKLTEVLFYSFTLVTAKQFFSINGSSQQWEVWLVPWLEFSLWPLFTKALSITGENYKNKMFVVWRRVKFINLNYLRREYLFWKTYNALQYRAVTLPEKGVVSEDNQIVQ